MRLFVSAIALAAAIGAAHGQQKVVNVYNWSDYIDTRALDEFKIGRAHV